MCAVVLYGPSSVGPQSPFSPWVPGVKTSSCWETQQEVITLYLSNCPQPPHHSSLTAFDLQINQCLCYCPIYFTHERYHILLTTSTTATGSSPLAASLTSVLWSLHPPSFWKLSINYQLACITSVSPSSPLLAMSPALWLPLLLSTLDCMWPAHELLHDAGALSSYIPHGLGEQCVPWALLCNVIPQWIFSPHIPQSLSRLHSEPSTHCLPW